MSFGFSIGDIISVSLLIKDVAKTCMNSPQHIRDTGDVLADSSILLDNLYPLTEAYTSQHPKDSGFIDRVCVRLRALEDDVYQTRDLVEKWKRGWVLDRVWLPLRYTSKIDEKRARIEAHNVRIGQLLNADIFKTLHVDQPAAEAKYAAELKAKLDIHEEFLREDAQKKDQLLQEILEKRGKDNIFQAACSEDPQQWKAIEADLTKAEPKMTAHDASKLLQPYKDDIQSTKWKMAGPILCVDLRQGALSTMAQFHLEYLRLHAATGTQDFLTKRIEAAGYLLESDLTKRAIDAKAVRFSLDKKQVGARRALDCVEISYGKEATALEMIQLVKRLRNDREARGVKLRHFQDFDHILCFNEEAYTALIQLRQFAKTLHPANTGPSLKGWISLFPVQYSSHRVPQAFADVKMALNSFAERNWDGVPRPTWDNHMQGSIIIRTEPDNSLSLLTVGKRGMGIA